MIMITPDANVERWLPVAQFEDLYEVSNVGRVRSLRTGSVMRPLDSGAGYQRVFLCRAGKKIPAYVHRLVAVAFIPNPQGLPTVNHKNLVRSDNAETNIEWCSYRHNNLHSRHFGQVKKNTQGVRGLTNDEAAQVRSLYSAGCETQRSLAKKYKTKQKTIWNIVNSKTYNRFGEAA